MGKIYDFFKRFFTKPSAYDRMIGIVAEVPKRNTNQRGFYSGGLLPNLPEGIDPESPDWNDPRMREWAAQHLPKGPNVRSVITVGPTSIPVRLPTGLNSNCNCGSSDGES